MANSVKINVIISNFPIVWLLTLGIYPLVSSILLLVYNREFKNSSYAITTGVLGIVLSLFGIVPFIMGFFLSTSKDNHDFENRNLTKMELWNKEVNEVKKLLENDIITQEEYDQKISDLKNKYF